MKVVVVTILLLANCHAFCETLIEEASGITRYKDILIIVGDNDLGTYYEYDITGLTEQSKIVIDDPDRLTRKRIIDAEIPLDLEGAGILHDGTVALLSEQTNSLLIKDRTLYWYSSSNISFGNRGLEGLAIRPGKNKNESMVAVTLEGGYPSEREMPIGLSKSLADRALAPVLTYHVIDANGKSRDLVSVSLNMAGVNKWIDSKIPLGREPMAFRFRAPGIEWYKDGFIVLLTSERPTLGLSLSDKDRYGPKVLQRFDMSGEPIGEPYDLTGPLDDVGSDSRLNWEGLGWFEPDKKLMLIFDHPTRPPDVAIIDLPEGW